MEAGDTTIGNEVRHVKLILSAQLLPVGLMVARKHEDNLYGGVVGVKSVERAHQHGTTFHWDKLLGQLTAHTQSLTSCYNNGIFLHSG